MDAVHYLSRSDQRRVYGIDCYSTSGDSILFRGGEWNPEGEYTQRLTIKNVSLELKKIRYKLPTAKIFSLPYPKTITLSPGMTYSVEVLFRPVACQMYQDSVYIELVGSPKDMGFHISLQAVLSVVELIIPDSLDMGFCRINVATNQSFHIVNSGQIPAEFSWKVPSPFSFSPNNGIVPVSGSVEIKCSINPKNAAVFMSKACICIRGKNEKNEKNDFALTKLGMVLSCISKYSYISLSTNRVDFGKKTIGDEAEDPISGMTRKVVIQNESCVPAEIKIERIENDLVSSFELYPKFATVLPNGVTTIHIAYKPLVRGMYVCDHYKISSIEGNSQVLSISGWAQGPAVWISRAQKSHTSLLQDSLNFNEVEVGSSASKVVTLNNMASIPCRFNVMVPRVEEGVFKFSCVQGIIPGSSLENPGKTQFAVSFMPKVPINFYRRFYILLENQMPILMDCFATGYICPSGEVQEQRPAPIRHAHFDAFCNRADADLSRLDPKDLDTLFKSRVLPGDFFAVQDWMPCIRGEVEGKVFAKSGDCTASQLQISNEYFDSDLNSNLSFHKEINVDFDWVDFGRVNIGKCEVRYLKLINHTRGKVSASFFIGGDEFKVDSDCCDIESGGTKEFMIRFEPAEINKFFVRELEIYVYFKNQRTFRLVRDETLVPPWCIKVLLEGNSFECSYFAPKCSISTSDPNRKLQRNQIVFPPCFIGESVFQTVSISNDGFMPAYFRYETPTSGSNDTSNPNVVNFTSTFEVKPKIGLIEAGEVQLIGFRFSPTVQGHHEFNLKCIFNHSEEQQINLIGQGCVPSLHILQPPANEMNQNIYFKPTAVGMSTARTVILKNGSRIPISYTIRVPGEFSRILSVTPSSGTILGNDSLNLNLKFEPREFKIYNIDVPIEVRSICGSIIKHRDSRKTGKIPPSEVYEIVHFHIHASSVQAEISFTPETLNFGEILANSSITKEVYLNNTSDCDISYKLNYEVLAARCTPNIKKCNSNSISNTSGAFLNIDQPIGILYSRSKKAIKVSFTSVYAGTFEFSLVCSFISNVGNSFELPAQKIKETLKTLVNYPEYLSIQDELNINTKNSSYKIKNDSKSCRTGPDLMKLASLESSFGFSQNSVLDHMRTQENLTPRIGPESTEMTPIWCKVIGSSAFPTVTVSDIQIEGGSCYLDTFSMWNLLDMPKVNALLSDSLSEYDVSLNTSSSPNLSGISSFPIQFTPAPIGTNTQKLIFLFKNPGSIKASLTIHLPNEREFEVDPWADFEIPTKQDMRQSDITEKLKVFEVHPLHVELQPGESSTLTVSYNYSSLKYEGQHDIPILIRISQGKQFYFHLKGTTLVDNSPNLYQPTTPNGTLTLESIPLGTPITEVPVQKFNLYNTGNGQLHYKIIDKSLVEHGVTIVRMEKESLEGTIMGLGKREIGIYFCPLVAKMYEMEILVKWWGEPENSGYVDESTRVYRVVLKMNGFDSRFENDAYRESLNVRLRKTGQLPLTVQTMPVDSTFQPVMLSSRFLQFGRLPVGSCCNHQILILQNTLQNDFVQFDWPKEDVKDDFFSSVTLYPMTGIIEPGGCALIKVSINTICEPRVVDSSLPVSIKRLKSEETKKVKSSAPHETKLSTRKSKNSSNQNSSRISVVSRSTVSRTIAIKDTYNRYTKNCQDHIDTDLFKENANAFSSTYHTVTDLNTVQYLDNSTTLKNMVDCSRDESILHVRVSAYIMSDSTLANLFPENSNHFIVKHIPISEQKVAKKESFSQEYAEQLVCQSNDFRDAASQVLNKILKEVFFSNEVSQVIERYDGKIRISPFEDISTNRKLDCNQRILVGLNIRSPVKPEDLDKALEKFGIVKNHATGVFEFVSRDLKHCKLKNALFHISAATKNIMTDLIDMTTIFNDMDNDLLNSFQCYISAHIEKKLKNHSSSYANQYDCVNDQRRIGAAVILQCLARTFLSRRYVSKMRKEKIEKMIREVTEDQTARNCVSTVLEHTLFSIFEEAVNGEFQLNAKPVRSIIQ